MMKKFLFCVVLLSISIALIHTSQAQQTSPVSSSSQSGANSPDAGDRGPIQAPRPTDFWDGDDPNLVNLVTHPFARKAYVLRHTQPIRDRLNELDELTAENAKTIKEIDARSTQGIQLASEKASLADQHATDAANQAQLAQTAANQASMRVSSAEESVRSLDQYKSGSQTEIRFRSGQTVLSKNAKDALDQMATPLRDQHNYIVEIRGFTPGRGHAAIATSQKMADSVVRYLVLTHKIPLYRIYVLSMGNAAISTEESVKRVTSARVDISVLQNESVAAVQH